MCFVPTSISCTLVLLGAHKLCINAESCSNSRAVKSRQFPSRGVTALPMYGDTVKQCYPWYVATEAKAWRHAKQLL